MKKFEYPMCDIEKFEIADMITASVEYDPPCLENNDTDLVG